MKLIHIVLLISKDKCFERILIHRLVIFFALTSTLLNPQNILERVLNHRLIFLFFFLSNPYKSTPLNSQTSLLQSNTNLPLNFLLRSKGGCKRQLIDMIQMDEHIIMSSSPNRLVECRICHSEDEDSNMDTPCSCCGTLKVGSPCSLPLQMLVSLLGSLNINFETKIIITKHIWLKVVLHIYMCKCLECF